MGGGANDPVLPVTADIAVTLVGDWDLIDITIVFTARRMLGHVKVWQDRAGEPV